MRKLLCCIVVGLALVGLSGSSLWAGQQESPVPVIYDTDFGSDCDDAGALAVLHALADRGETEILAVISVTGRKHVPGAIDAINTYYGRPDLPIGAPVAGVWASWDRYAKHLAEGFTHDVKGKENVPPAVELYRKILSKQPDNSVTIISVGFLRNMQNLLNSTPDKHSKLHGAALVARKVDKLVCMAGKFPKGTEWNMKGGPWDYGSSAQRVVKDWPTEVIFTGYEIGHPIMTGARLLTETPESNPVREAYRIHPGTTEEGDRHSWDLTAILYGVRGARDYWDVHRQGHLVVHNDGSNTWKNAPHDPRSGYLVQKMAVPKMEEVLGDLLVRPPGNR